MVTVQRVEWFVGMAGKVQMNARFITVLMMQITNVADLASVKTRNASVKFII